jgi:CHASE3 domain sensor protein
MRVVDLVRKNVIIFSAVLVLMLIVANGVVVMYNKAILKETNLVKQQTDQVRTDVGKIWGDVVRAHDVSVRGFVISKDEHFLTYLPQSIATYKTTSRAIDSILQIQKFPTMALTKEMFLGIEEFIDVETDMVRLTQEGDSAGFMQLFKQDPGFKAWGIYSKNSGQINAFESKLAEDAIVKYENVNATTTILQVILVIVGVPTLLFMVFRIIKDKKERTQLFVDLEKNNRAYLFDPGNELEVKNEKEVIQNSINNFKRAAQFINHISMGNYQVNWEGLNEKNQKVNKTNLAGELLQMKEKMVSLKAEDEKRNWTTEGLARFSEVIRNHQHNLQGLCYEVLVFLTKYLNAQQGAVFVLMDDNEDDVSLEMVACYAFDKKKHINKNVKIGQGLIGQTYLERQPLLLTEIPQGYTSITSGLGENTPGSLLIVPMQYNEKVEAVIELAGFEKFQGYQIDFMRRVGEITASTLGAVRNNEKTQKLLEQFRDQTEMLRAQEEELRQNMEEMQATQEAVKRADRVNLN